LEYFFIPSGIIIFALNKIENNKSKEDMKEGNLLIIGKQERAIRTQSKLLKAAAEVFAEKGFDGCTIRQIGKRAGLNHQKIVYHFGTKEELFLAVVKEGFELFDRTGTLLAMQEDKEDPIEKFKAVLKKVAKVHYEHPYFIRILYHESFKKNEQLTKLHPYIEQYRDRVYQNLLFLQKHGFGSNIPIDNFTTIFFGTFDAWFIQPFNNSKTVGANPDKDLIKMEAYIDSFFTLFSDR